MKGTTTQQRDRLISEREEITERRHRRRSEDEGDCKRLRTIEQELHRLSIIELVGKPGAVKPRYRERKGTRCEHLNDLTGTVVEVRRTRALVDFGEGGRWEMPVQWVLPADGTQGFVLL